MVVLDTKLAATSKPAEPSDDDHQQPTFSDDNLYHKPCKNPVMISETPSLCYDKDKEETPEREELLRKLKKKNK